MTFVDTAGLRESDDVVEKIGIDKSFEEVASADIIIMVFDASAQYTEQEIMVYESIVKKYYNKIIFVQNKVDAGSFVLPFLQKNQYVSVSAATLHNIDLLRQVIDHQVEQLLEVGQSPFLINKRQHNLLLQVSQHIANIQKSMLGKIEYELLVVHVSDALSKLSEITGKTVTEDALNAIFQEFCVGK
jgi:tRNA modification GTPase